MITDTLKYHTKESKTLSKDECEDNDIIQMLKDAESNFSTQKNEELKRDKVLRENSTSSNKIPGVCNPHNNSSLCLYGTESGKKLHSNYKLNISNLQNYEDEDCHNDSKLERIGETEREY